MNAPATSHFDFKALDERAVSALESGDPEALARFEREMGVTPAFAHAEIGAGRSEALQQSLAAYPPKSQDLLLTVLGEVPSPPFYIWANEDCANTADDFDGAKLIRKSLIDDGAEEVYIVDADGVEVVDAEIEADELQMHAASVQDEGSALEAPLHGSAEIMGSESKVAAVSSSLDEMWAKWDLLAEVPLDETLAITVPFLHFASGTPRQAIWSWLEEQNPQFVVSDVIASDMTEWIGEHYSALEKLHRSEILTRQPPRNALPALSELGVSQHESTLKPVNSFVSADTVYRADVTWSWSERKIHDSDYCVMVENAVNQAVKIAESKHNVLENKSYGCQWEGVQFMGYDQGRVMAAANDVALVLAQFPDAEPLPFNIAQEVEKPVQVAGPSDSPSPGM